MKKLFRKSSGNGRVILLRRRHLAVPAALLCICALCLVANLPAYVSAAATTRQLPIYCVEREQKVCALSFDAAWGDARVRALGEKGFLLQHFKNWAGGLVFFAFFC